MCTGDVREEWVWRGVGVERSGDAREAPGGVQTDHVESALDRQPGTQPSPSRRQLGGQLI